MIYPSVVEGFGLVPFEAAAVGTPCLSPIAGTAPGELLGVDRRRRSTPGSPTAGPNACGRGSPTRTQAIKVVQQIRDVAKCTPGAQCAERTWEAIDAAARATEAVGPHRGGRCGLAGERLGCRVAILHRASDSRRRALSRQFDGEYVQRPPAQEAGPMSESTPIYIDATMILRWQHLAPVGIVRLERLLAGHLRFGSTARSAQYVVWDAGLPAGRRTTKRRHSIACSATPRPRSTPSERVVDCRLPVELAAAVVLACVRRVALKGIGTTPRPSPTVRRERCMVGRHVRRRVGTVLAACVERPSNGDTTVAHPRRTRIMPPRRPFPTGTDLVALGPRLGVPRPRVDVPPEARTTVCGSTCRHSTSSRCSMPQMNAGQSHLVHRYYAEMAHYADSITSISEATQCAIEQFFADESLPDPHLAVNPLPGIDDSRAPPRRRHVTGRRRHRFVGERLRTDRLDHRDPQEPPAPRQDLDRVHRRGHRHAEARARGTVRLGRRRAPPVGRLRAGAPGQVRDLHRRRGRRTRRPLPGCAVHRLPVTDRGLGPADHRGALVRQGLRPLRPTLHNSRRRRA